MGTNEAGATSDENALVGVRAVRGVEATPAKHEWTMSDTGGRERVVRKGVRGDGGLDASPESLQQAHLMGAFTYHMARLSIASPPLAGRWTSTVWSFAMIRSCSC